MTSHYHALVWIDHREAKIFHIDAAQSDQMVIKSTHPNQHIHHKANSGDSGHAPIDKEYLNHVTNALADAGAILVSGPASAKTELVSYMKTHNPKIAGRISAVETLDHPTDGALLALGRKFFKADDRMHGIPSKP